MKKATKIELSKFKELVGNKIFSVVFIKKNGSERQMTCRFGVKKHLQGGELKYNPASLGYLTVFDMTELDYRTVNLNTLISFTYDGVTYEL